VTERERQINVLLLEDDELDAELVVEQLKAGDISARVRRVETAPAFVAALSEAPDLILSDFALPGYDGMAALSAAKEHCPDVPFIFVSGAIGEERAIDILQRGATDYVLKNRLARLPSAVVRALGLAEERRRRQRAEAERDRLLESERLARATAESANRMKDEFLAVASHELRTPLNAILGWSTLLSSGEAAPELVSKGLGIIKRNALAQSRLIEDILDISRIVTGKLQLHPTHISVESIVQAAVEAVRPAATAKGVSLSVNIDVPEGINGDAERLQQVVWNLLSNAVKFTPAQGRVELIAEPSGTDVTIRVIDSGEGIEPEFLPHVFERFRQADPSATRRAGGLGLGLSIVRYLVEAHGGTTSAESAGKGQGSCFIVRLPRESRLEPRISDAPGPASAEHEAEVPSGGTLRGLTVLLVEDDVDSRELVAFILRSRGAHVVSASSAQQALELLVTSSPHVVISDIGMPDMDGYSFIRRLREQPAHLGGNVPAIALTAYTREVDRRQAEAAGFQRHLAKPVSAGLLLRVVADTVAAGPRESNT
jgi:signal transduction histidine kinase